MFNTYNGFRIVENSVMVECYGKEDWNRVRSPGRARRRRVKHRQNIVPLYEPSKEFVMDKINNVIYCHPEMAKELYRRIQNA